MFIKKLNHLHRTLKVRQNSAFAVLGYPRSGTTMMSEIIGMVSDYYFDRDNVFPSSSKVVLHTHWNPEWYPPGSSVYIMRNPIDVHLSLVDYADGNGWSRPKYDALKSKKYCGRSWYSHCYKAKLAGHLIINYDKFVSGDFNEFEKLAKHLGVPSAWIISAQHFLNDINSHQPHETDKVFRENKRNRDQTKIMYLRQVLKTTLAAEIEFYES